MRSMRSLHLLLVVFIGLGLASACKSTLTDDGCGGPMGGASSNDGGAGGPSGDGNLGIESGFNEVAAALTWMF